MKQRDDLLNEVKDKLSNRYYLEQRDQELVNDCVDELLKAINYSQCCELLICNNDNIIDKSLTLNKEYAKIHEHNGMVVIVNDFDEVMSYNKEAFFKAN